jgi:hypothetical protein
MADLIAVGRVQSISSPLFLAVDADVGTQWLGDNDSFDDVNSDAYRASEAVLESDSIVIRAKADFQPIFAAVVVGGGQGLVMRIGSSGIVDVFRQGRRFFLVDGVYHHVRTVKRDTATGVSLALPADQAYLDYVAAAASPHAVSIGTVSADSGWLLLLPTVAAGNEASEHAAAAKTTATVYQTEKMRDRELTGLLLRVPPGTYKISVEPEADLDIGLAARAIIDPA